MSNGFTHAGYEFRLEQSSGLPGDIEDWNEEEFDKRLMSTGRVPELGRAPIASWLLARLARLTDDGFPSSGVERNDGGGWAVDFTVRADDDEIAHFQLQGDMDGAAILGTKLLTAPGEQILEAIADALVASPDDVLVCELKVVDPEWAEDPEMYQPRPKKGVCNRYGWKENRYLGSNNIREKMR